MSKRFPVQLHVDGFSSAVSTDCGSFLLDMHFYCSQKSREYSNIKNYNIYQTNVINLKQLVLISKIISPPN